MPKNQLTGQLRHKVASQLAFAASNSDMHAFSGRHDFSTTNLHESRTLNERLDALMIARTTHTIKSPFR